MTVAKCTAEIDFERIAFRNGAGWYKIAVAGAYR
jgi:hypothetical protein